MNLSKALLQVLCCLQSTATAQDAFTIEVPAFSQEVTLTANTTLDLSIPFKLIKKPAPAPTPSPTPTGIVWSATHEDGTMNAWNYPSKDLAGGCLCNTQEQWVTAVASRNVAKVGSYSAINRITNAIQHKNGPVAVRMMRWTDKPWNAGGKYLPLKAYYGTWIYFPHVYNPNLPDRSGWWIIFQFKHNNSTGVNDVRFSVNVKLNESTRKMELYVYDYVAKRQLTLTNPVIEAGRWFHLEAYYASAADTTGQMTLWKDGVQLISLPNIKTAFAAGKEQVFWGVGNYTEHVDGPEGLGTATIYFDNCAVSTERLFGKF